MLEIRTASLLVWLVARGNTAVILGSWILRVVGYFGSVLFAVIWASTPNPA